MVWWKIPGFFGRWPSQEDAQAVIDGAKRKSESTHLDDYSRAYYRRLAKAEPQEIQGEQHA